MYSSKTFILRVLILISGVFSTSGVWATPDLSKFSLVFEDRFEGDQLDENKWNTGFLWGPYYPINSEEQIYIDALGMHVDNLVENGGKSLNPFEFTGSTLKIIARPVGPENEIPVRPNIQESVWQDYPEYRYNGDDPENPDDEFFDPSTVNYTSGVITSYESFRFTHGYAEARMRLPAGDGLWSAFWLSTSFYVEDVPEIDIVEFLGDQTDTVYHTYHYFEPENNWQRISTPSYVTQGPDFSNDWHTYGVAWSPHEIIWYVDGQETRRIENDEFKIANQAMYVIANLAVGGVWPGAPSLSTTFPAEVELDYIQVWQLNTPEIVTQDSLETDYTMVFSDEFDGDALDTSIWNTHFLWGPYWQINQEQQFYPDIGDTHSDFTPSPIVVSDGSLKITAHSVTLDQLPVLPAQDSVDFIENPEWRHNEAYLNPSFSNPPFGDPNHDRSAAAGPFLPTYASGLITSYDSFKFVYGYAEIRAKLPAGDGLWPAFWLLNGYYVDQQPEIDVIELRGELPQELVHSYHYSETDGTTSSWSSSTFLSSPAGYSDEFHTYGVSWERGKIDWYVDGVKQHTLRTDYVSSQVMYPILNLAVGGNFNYEAVDPSVFPATFEIDYIRIYQPNVGDAIEERDDAVREAALDTIISSLEAYGAGTGSYEVAGGGWRGSGLGWFHYEQGSYSQSVANVLVNEGYLAAPAPKDPLLANPGVYSPADFLVYTCKDRIAVFSISDELLPTSSDAQWWSRNGCTRYPIESLDHRYFKLSAALPVDDDVERDLALDEIIAALEAYGSDSGSYVVTGGGWSGTGLGWFHYEQGSYAQSVANALVSQGYLLAPAPQDPQLANPGQYSAADFLIYTCRDRVAVFSLSDELTPMSADSQWWSDNGCTRYPIDSLGHSYFKLSAPLPVTDDVVRESALDTIISSLEAYGADTGSYIVAGGGWSGSGLGWFHYQQGRYVQSVANVLVDQGYLAAPVPKDPQLLVPGEYSPADFLIYTCRDRVAIFSLSDALTTSSVDAEWWASNNCTRYPIDSLGHGYFKLSSRLGS